MGGRFMLDVHTAYDQKGKASVLSPGAGQQLQIYAVHLLNRTAAAMDMGVLINFAPSGYKFGLITGGAVVADATAALQAGTAQNLFTTTANDGFLVQSLKKFGLVGFTVSQAQTGAPVYAYKYYNGTSYVDLPDYIEVPSYSTIGDKLIVFAAPRDWVPGSTAGVGGDSDKYSLLVSASTAPGQSVQATAIWVARFLHFQPQVATNGLLSLTYHEQYCRLLDSLEGLLPYFATADAKNQVTAKYFSID